MAEQVDAEVKGIFEEAPRRYKKGEQTYGVFDKDNDPRDLLKEAEEEMLDVMVYMAFEIARARGLRSRLDSVHAQLSRRLTSDGKDGIERQASINTSCPLSKQDHEKIVQDIIIPAINAAGDRSVRISEAARRFMVKVSSPDLEGLRFDGSEELHYEPLAEKEER